MVCLGNIFINTLQKGAKDEDDDNDDDDNNNNNIHNYKPDIQIRDNERGTCMLRDVAISGDRNVIKKEGENFLKYADLTIETQRMWKFSKHT
jgi:hypothetical protein